MTLLRTNTLLSSLFQPRLLCIAVSLGLGVTSTANADAVLNDDIETIEIQHRQAYRGDISLKDLPQAIEVLDKTLITDLGVTRFQDILDFSPSIARQNDNGGVWDGYSIRGFPGNENIPSGFLVNGFNEGRSLGGRRDLSNVEYIEILKGPGSALYGRSEPGGTINIITRKPQFDSKGYVRFSAGRFDQYRVEADYTSGVTDTVAVRLNGAIQQNDSFRDHVFNNKRVFTPSIHWQVSDSTSLLYEVNYVKHETLFDRAIVVLNNDINTVPHSRYMGEPNDGPTTVHAKGHNLTLNHTINSNWSLLAGYNYRRSTLKGLSSDTELSPSRQSLYDDNETLTRQRRQRDYYTEDNSFRVELSGSEEFLNMTHHLLIGADTSDYELITTMYRYRGGNGTYAINIHNPQYGQAKPEVGLLYDDQDKQQAYGFYFQDQMDVTDDLKVLVGLRFDDYEQSLNHRKTDVTTEQSDSRVSPRFGLVYSINENLSLYSSYSEGFTPLTGNDFYGNAFEPEESESFEVGAKYESERVNVLFTVFDADKTNILTSDPINAGFSTAVGAANSRGVEVEVDTQLTDDLSLSVAYAYLDTKTSNDMINPDWGVEIPAGSRLINVPENTLNVRMKQYWEWSTYSGHVGMYARFVDDRLGETINPDYVLPSYTVAGVFASAQLSDKLSINVNIDNLFDEAYIASSYSPLWSQPGVPLSFRVGATYTF